jgi:hypothetical protein
MADNTLFCGDNSNKIFWMSSQFVNVIKGSAPFGNIDSAPKGVSVDSSGNTIIAGDSAAKIYRLSGLLGLPHTPDPKLLNSQAVGNIDLTPNGVTTDGTNNLWCGEADNKIYLSSGYDDNTLLASTATPGGLTPRGISFDGTYTYLADATNGRLLKLDGKISKTVSASTSILNEEALITGIGSNGAGNDTLFVGRSGDKVYRVDGEISDTYLDSQTVNTTGAIYDGNPWGICTDNTATRLGTGASKIPVFMRTYRNRRTT